MSRRRIHEGRLFRRKDSPFWFAEIFDSEGNRRKFSTHKQVYAEALREMRLMQARADDPHALRSAREVQHRVSEAMTYYVETGSRDRTAGTISCYRQRGAHVVRLLGERAAESLGMDDVHSYAARRLDEKAAPESVRKEICILRAALRMAFRRGLLRVDIYDRLPPFRCRPAVCDRALPVGEFESLLNALPAPRRLWLLLAAYTGGRDSELMAYAWEHIDWPQEELRILGTKTDGARRVVPIPKRLLEALREAKPEHATGPILLPWNNRRRDLAAACKRAGIQKVTPNDMRRTFASWLVRSGTPLLVVKELMGHRSTRMLERHYARLDRATLRKAANKLPKGRATKKTDPTKETAG